MSFRRGMVIAVAMVALAAFALAADVTGTWTAVFETDIGTQNYTYVFKQEGKKLTGVAKSALAEAETQITEGSVEGDDISFVENLNFQGMALRIAYKGKINGDQIELTRNVADIATEKATAKKTK